MTERQVCAPARERGCALAIFPNDRERAAETLRRLSAEARRIAETPDQQLRVRELLDLSAETHRFAARMAPTDPELSKAVTDLAEEVAALARAQSGNGASPDG